jgi:surface antigen
MDPPQLWEVSMRLAFRVAAVLVAASSLAVAPPLAQGKGKAKHDHEHGGDDDVQVVTVYGSRSHGPPPWAPAHGYRRKYRKMTYVAPYGIHLGTCDRTLLGAALGGAAGGLIGAEVAKKGDRTEAIIGGTLLGILIGGAIGNSMDQVDHGCVGQVLEHAPSNQTVEWKNPDHGTSYGVTPGRTWQEEDGQYCREYTTSVRIGGEPQRAYGKACRQPDGSWQRVG